MMICAAPATANLAANGGLLVAFATGELLRWYPAEDEASLVDFANPPPGPGAQAQCILLCLARLIRTRAAGGPWGTGAG